MGIRGFDRQAAPPVSRAMLTLGTWLGWAPGAASARLTPPLHVLVEVT